MVESQERVESKRRGWIWIKVMLPIGGVLVCLLSLELTLRVVAVIVRPRFTRVDDELGWYHTPNASATRTMEGHAHDLSYNAMGFRGRDIPFERTPGSPRVLFLGDSFVDGSEVGDREVFSDRLETRFPCLEVVNLGVYGYSTTQELLAFDRVGRRYQSDLVVLVSISNDFIDNIRNFSEFGPAPRFLPDGESLVLEGTRHREADRAMRLISLPVPGMRFLQAHSHLYWMVNSRIYQRLRAPAIVQLEQEQQGRFTAEERHDLYVRLVHRLHEHVRREGSDFVVVFAYMRDELRTGPTSPYAAVIDALRASGISVVDLYQRFGEELSASREPLFYEKDIHWNAAGHRVFADLVSASLSETLSPRRPRSCMVGP